MDYHITDYHREIGARYYKKLLDRLGLVKLLRYIPVIKRIIWTRQGIGLIEKHLKEG